VQPPQKLGLVIDLDTCVGCHACATNCKEWNTGGIFRAAHRRQLPMGPNVARGLVQPRSQLRGHTTEGRRAHRTFSPLCLHCAEPACVTVCPTGASYKRAEDGIVLIDEDKCIGCKLCAWACPYGAREFDR
jgi:Fe-S-cluster-containing dehydrogenase component